MTWKVVQSKVKQVKASGFLDRLCDLLLSRNGEVADGFFSI